MSLLSTVFMALVVMSAIPLSAAGKTSPYLEIIEPLDGSTVGQTTTLVVEAEGLNLHNPTASVVGEQIGTGFPLTGCVFEEANGGPMRMHCTKEISLSAFEGQKVAIRVSVDSDEGPLTDSVGVSVSGHCVQD